MIYQLSAACGCHIGRIRGNNEDNFYFAGKYMRQDNQGMRGILSMKCELTDSECFAVFDGMGGEASGEVAAFSAAESMKLHCCRDVFIAEAPREYLESVCQEMNLAVYRQAQELCVTTMGTTAVILYFTPDEVYVCNLGDSKAFRLRDNALMQISTDDLETLPSQLRRKPGITQYLGISPEDMKLEPHIVKGNIRAGDIYMVCSDGITDMLSNVEIFSCLRNHISPKKSVQDLLQTAIHNGGRDNATAIVVRVL